MPPSKTFTRTVFELLGVARRAHHHIRLGSPFRSDLRWWATFLGTWNGVAMLPGHGTGQPAHHVWTDASGGFGCEAVYSASQQWVPLQWPESNREGELTLREESITLTELLPVVHAGVCSVGVALAPLGGYGPLRQHGGGSSIRGIVAYPVSCTC